MTKKLYKVTCTSQTYTHYWVRAESKKDAEENYGNFEKTLDDPLYGANDEEVLEAVQVKDDDFPYIKVKIAWGSDRDERNITEYRFDTKEEYYAFMRGVDASNGWLDYSTIGEGESFETVEDWRKYYGKD